ncbi:MAG TPA: serine hydrolase domain-containing protein [Thermoanaerobaculia bacterium]
MKSLLPALLLIAALPLAASERGDIDRFVATTLRAFPEVPGVAVAVVKDGKPFFASGYGFADVASKRAMTGTTPVYIASSTKSFTGLMCAMLAQQGKLDLDKPIVAYLPELESWSDSKRVTMRMLLTHSAGIRNDAITIRTAYTGEHTPEQLVRLLGSSKSIEPKFRYDNLGYVVSALIAERVTGKKWQDLLQEMIFAPLGMKDTTAYMSRVRGLATPYSISIGHGSGITAIANLKSDATMHAAGGVVTTASDLQQWLAANLSEPSAAYREVHKRQVTVPDVNWYKFRRYAYGFGWYWSDYDGKLLMHHFGGFEGWYSHVSYMPALHAGVVVIANSSAPGTSDVSDMIATYIYDRLAGRSDIEPVYAERIAETRKASDARWTRIAADVESRSKRPPSLTRDPAAYTGDYTNEQLGTMSITNDGGVFHAKLGLLASVLEPFTNPDSARVELIPGGGQKLQFQFTDAPRATAIDWSDYVFTRVTTGGTPGGLP